MNDEEKRRSFEQRNGEEAKTRHFSMANASDGSECIYIREEVRLMSTNYLAF